MKYLLLVFLIFPSWIHAQTPFSSDSALAYLKTISVTIGARPMGSLNERRAMEFALSKFHEFGLNETSIMNFQTARYEKADFTFNTNSGIAVGTLHGKTDRIIIIGGHIDSESPFILGANDDGSGSAAVLELARVLSKEHLQSTIVFCLFGGEEAGVIGSKYFVNHYPLIDSVALMINLDMANGSDILIPTIDCKTGNTPIWLVQAAYEEFAKLGYTGLRYFTHFFTAMSFGSIGSDHEPFLEKNIPAIDFTSDIDDPIHTPQDDFEHFKPSGLKRSGDLAYALVHRFDNTVPAEKTSDYYLLQIGNRALFFPLWLITTANILSVVLAIGALIVLRKRRTEIESSQRPKVPALKLFLLALLIHTCVWSSENLVGFIKGVRYAWITQPEGYFVLGFLAALLGIALSLKLTPRMNLSHDPYRWFLRTVVFLVAFIFLLSLVNMKIALYPALALLLLSCAMLVHKPWLKIAFWILSPHFMFRMIFSEGFIFTGRSTALHSMQPEWMYAVLHIFYILFFALWSFPFLLGFAAIYFDSGVNLLWLTRWRTRAGWTIAAIVFILCVIILSILPSYSDQWRQNIFIDQSLNLNTGEGKIVLKSNDYLKNLKVHFAEKDTEISTWERDILLQKFTPDKSPWIQAERTMIAFSDSNSTFDILLKLHFKFRPKSFVISYSTSKNELDDRFGEYITSSTPHSVTMRWKSFTDTSIMIPLHMRVMKGDSITETIEAKFIELAEPVRIEKQFSNIIPQTTMLRTEVLHASDTK